MDIMRARRFEMLAVAWGIVVVPLASYAQLPSSFDLRDVNGENYVTYIKD